MHGVFTAVHRQHVIKGLTRCGLDRRAPTPRVLLVLAQHPDAARLRVMLREKGIAVRRGDTFPDSARNGSASPCDRTARIERLVRGSPMVTELDRAAGRRRRTRRPAASTTTPTTTAPTKASGPTPPTDRSAANAPEPISVSTPQERS